MRRKMLQACAVILMTTALSLQAPVQAEEAPQQKLVWHNLEIRVKKPTEAEKPDETSVTLEDYKRISKGGKVITTQESQKVFGAPFYRPAPFRLPLVSSNGLYHQIFTLKDGKIGEPKELFEHWDIFESRGEWAVVIQDIDSYTRDMLDRKEIVRDEYPGYMKLMQIPGSDNYGILTPFSNSDRKRLSVQILDPQGKVVRLQIIGNLAEQDLLSLATGYKPLSH